MGVILGVSFLLRGELTPAPEQAHGGLALSPVVRVEHLLNCGHRRLAEAKHLPERFLGHFARTPLVQTLP